MAIYNEQEALNNAKKLIEQQNKVYDDMYATGITGLQNQVSTASEQYNPYRNAAELQSQIDAKTLNEKMANLGLTRSGTNLTQQTALVTAKQNTLSNINSQEMETSRQLKQKLNEYISQRDSSKQQFASDTMSKTYSNIDQYKQNLAVMEKQQQYQREQAAYNAQLQREQAAYNAQLQQQAEQRKAAQAAQQATQAAQVKANGTAIAQAVGSAYKGQSFSNQNDFYRAIERIVTTLAPYGETSVTQGLKAAGYAALANDDATLETILTLARRIG